MKRISKLICMLLTGVMLLGLIPAVTVPAEAAQSGAGQYVSVTIGGARIGNGDRTVVKEHKLGNIVLYTEYAGDPEDMFNNFTSGTAGFSKSTEHSPKVSGNVITMEDPNMSATFSVSINSNPILKALAASSTAEYRVTGTVKSDGGSYHATIPGHKDYERGRLTVSDNRGSRGEVTASHDSVDDSEKSLDTGWVSLTNLSSITIKASSAFSCDTDDDNWNDDGEAYVEAHLYFRDITGPSLSSYTCSHGATVNSQNNKELLMKLGVKNANNPDDYYYSSSAYNSDTAAKNSRDWVDLQFNFSKPVTVGIPNGSGLASAGDTEYQSLANHTLFNNTAGTGFPGQGNPRELKLTQSMADVNGYVSYLNYRYAATYGDFSGNNPIPNGGYIESGNSTHPSLLSKISAAGFHDAAGNPLTGIDGSKGKNIFDKNDGGYDVIVDAMPPTYSRVGNGVDPDILTQLVLNKNDKIEFVVTFNEAVITKRGWDNSKTYLMLDNGGRAYYKSKSVDGKQWIFSYTIPSGTEAEASLLKVIALANDALNTSLREDALGKQSRANDAAYSFNVDGRTITDYVGNIMVERANEDADTNTSQIQSSTGWAGLAVDNTAPDISFTYTQYGVSVSATPNEWGQATKVFTTASDTNVPVAKYDPDYSGSNTSRPSKGIYRPDNTTGSTASAVGLIFYVWTRSPAPPSTGSNFEAIKRFSLTGEQPKTVSDSTDSTYASAWSDLPSDLKMTNNYSDIVPPDDAMTSEGSGAWYLHVWTADMTWDSARQLMQYEKARTMQYKSGYTYASFLALKNQKVEEARNNSGGKLSYNEAWEQVKGTVFSTAYTDQFIGWLNESGSDPYSDAAMLYAKSQALLQLAEYENTAVWSLDDYAQDDSNWTVKTTRLLLDNTPPEDTEYDRKNMIGNGMAYVELPVTLSDTLSGLDVESIYFQWVPKEAGTTTENGWVQVKSGELLSKTEAVNAVADGVFQNPSVYGKASVSFIVTTLGNVDGDGEYILFIKYSDIAGNMTVSRSDSADLIFTVDSANEVRCTFGPGEAISSYKNVIVPTVTVEGVSLLAGKLEYAVTAGIDRPADGFAAVAVKSADNQNKVYEYELPAISDDETRADGIWYVHVLVYENAEQTTPPYYFREYYCLDRTAPTVTFNPNGYETDLDDAANLLTNIRLDDMLAGVAEGAGYYQITPDAEPVGIDAPGWEKLPVNGEIDLGDIRDEAFLRNGGYQFYVHVYAEDMTGNRTEEQISAAFVLRGEKAPTTLPPYGCQILTTALKEDGVSEFAVANLTLEAEDKTGYRYSLSDDGGETWCNWLPYMSMIRMDLPETFEEGDLLVKFKAPDGTTGEPAEISIETVSDPIWATAEFDSTFKRRSGDGNELTFLMSLPEDVEAAPITEGYTAAAPLGGESRNFTASANGVYAFELTRAGQTATSPLIIVVDIFDDTAPSAKISYSELAPTNGNVIATVKSDEPIYVSRIEVSYTDGSSEVLEPGKAQFAFQKNGTAIFTIGDEAHNMTTLTASVTNIDKEAPHAKINANYDLYATIGEGDDMIAAGATLEAQKPSSIFESFIVVNNDRSPIMEINENGDYTFIIRDGVGNIGQATYRAENIVNKLPGYTVTYYYTLKDAYGNEIPGEQVQEGVYTKGKVTAVVTFDPITDGRSIYRGTAKVDEYRNGLNPTTGEPELMHITNLLEQESGRFVYSRDYMANGESTLVFCDDFGNVERVPIMIKWIDAAAPTITFAKSASVISSDQTKRLPELTRGELKTLLGGLTLADNVFGEDDITLTVERSDDKAKATEEEKGRLDEVGKFTLVFTLSDPAGNTARYEQTLIVIPADGLLIEAGSGSDYALLSGLATNSSILPNNHVTFKVDKARMQAMFYQDAKVYNDLMEFDVFYVPGLYREGQLKTIATRVNETTVSAAQLETMEFEITFPKAGWYTIIIRNQERTREYTTFFIASVTE